MDEELEGIKFSEFPSASPSNTDEVVGLHGGNNARFSILDIIFAVRQGLANIFVPLTRTINNKALSSDITLDASDVGAVDTADVGVADGVASLDNTGKVPSSQLPPIASTAADVTYDNTTSGLNADDVQEALDELAAGAGGGGVDPETIAPVEETTTATVAHPLGSIFYLNDVLYRALSDIAVGGTINTGTGGNATQTTVAQNFKRTVTLASAEYAQLSAAEKSADIVYIITDDNTIPAEDVSYDPTASGLTATNVQGVVDELAEDKANQSQIAYVETGTTTSRAYSVGEYFCWNGLLYRVTAAISSGGTITPGTNCEQATVGAELTAIDSKMYQVKYEANGTYTYTLPAGRWFLIYANRANTSSAGLYAVHITSSSGYLTTIFETSNFSNLIVLTISGRTLSIQVKDRYATLNILNFGGV